MPDRSITSQYAGPVFDDEAGDQRAWGAAGYLLDDVGVLRSYRCDLTKSPGPAGEYTLQIHLIDVATGALRFQEEHTAGPPAALAGADRRFGRFARLDEDPDGLRLQVRADSFAIDLRLGHGKNGVCRFDDGALRMSPPGAGQTALWYSQTNLPTTGRLTVDGRDCVVSGKSWLDEQRGSSGLGDLNKFELRFFDDEEMVLFTSAQTRAQDGMYVPRAGQAQTLTRYSLVTVGETPIGDEVYPQGWRLHVPWIKAERYAIRPLGEGRVRAGRLELLAAIHDPTQRTVGYCSAELLPGVRNELPSNPFPVGGPGYGRSVTAP
jgi:hypothetical protein